MDDFETDLQGWNVPIKFPVFVTKVLGLRRSLFKFRIVFVRMLDPVMCEDRVQNIGRELAPANK
jgi:hypothetical protein